MVLWYDHRILSPTDVKNLQNHQYRSEGRSLLDQLFQPFWNWLVLQMPKWLAPNLITFIGLIVNIVTCLLVVYYNPYSDPTTNIPAWTLILCSLGLWIYQTLDNIDGKQARRVGVANPLGELFDHGCDAFSTNVVTAAYILVFRLEQNSNFYVLYSLSLLLYYVTHWECYVKSRLLFQPIDVTEAHYYLITCYILSAIWPDLWTTVVFEFEVRDLVLFAAVLLASVQLFRHISSIIVDGGPGENGSTKAGTGVATPALPMILLLIGGYHISSLSIFQEYGLIIMLLFGCATTKLTVKVIRSHICCSAVEIFDGGVHGTMAFILILLYLGAPEQLVLFLGVFWLFDMMFYCIQLVHEVTEALNISCFIVPKEKYMD